jgi:hypothetical protein
VRADRLTRKSSRLTSSAATPRSTSSLRRVTKPLLVVMEKRP